MGMTLDELKLIREFVDEQKYTNTFVKQYLKIIEILNREIKLKELKF